MFLRGPDESEFKRIFIQHGVHQALHESSCFRTSHFHSVSCSRKLLVDLSLKNIYGFFFDFFPFFIFKVFINLFLKRGEKSKKMKHQLVTSCTPTTGDLVHDPGIQPELKSNWWPFGLQGDDQPTESHQSGLFFFFFFFFFLNWAFMRGN